MKALLQKAWDHLEEIFLIPSLMFSVALIFLQVIMRKVFNNSLTWSEELARYLYVWQTWIGISYAARNGSHLRITMVKDRLSPKAQTGLELFVTLVWIGFAVFIIIQGMEAIEIITRFGQRSSALQVPMQVFYYSIPVGMSLMIIRLIERTIKGLRATAKSEKREARL